MRKPRYKTKAGLLTPYALACGYIEKYEQNNTQVTLEWDSCSYAVRAYDFNAHNRIAWDNYATLTDARKRYTELKRGVK